MAGSLRDDVAPATGTTGARAVLIDRRADSGAGTAAALGAAVLGFFVVTLDAVVVNVGLPSIRGELGGGITGLQWVVDGYTLVFAALLLSAGSLSDRFGARRVFGAGVAGFVLASLACGLAPSMGAGRRPVRAGRGGRDDDALLDGADRPGLPEHGHAGPGGGDLGAGRLDRLLGRPGARRGAHPRVLATDLRSQPAGRRDRAAPAGPHRALAAPAGAV
jgi:hypothetical protein